MIKFFFIHRNEYKLGNKVYLDVIATGSAAAQNRHEPVQQYVSRKNSVALRGKSIELWCVFGGTPLPHILWTKEGGSLPPGRTTYSNYGKTLIIKVRPSFSITTRYYQIRKNKNVCVYN